MIRVLHSGDWHIKDAMIEECRRVLGALVENAERELPNLAVIAGDIFHRADQRLGSESAALAIETINRLSAVCPVVILQGTRTHDGDAPRVLQLDRLPSQVWISTKPEQIFLYGGAIHTMDMAETLKGYGYRPEAIISTVPAIGKQYFQGNGSIAETDEAISRAVTAIFAGLGMVPATMPDVPHVLVGHWTVKGARLNERQVMMGRDIEMSLEQISFANASVTCLGHIHRAQDMGSGVFYCGSTYRENFGELDDKGFWLHTIEQIPEDAGAKLTESVFVELPATKRLLIEADFTRPSIEPSGIDLKVLQTYYRPDDLDNAMLRVRLRAYTDEIPDDIHTQVAALFNGHLADLKTEIVRVPRANTRSRRLLSLATLADKLTERAAITGEQPPAGALELAVALEKMTAEEILAEVAAS